MPFERVVFNISGNKAREETLEGRTHLVVPAVILTENVVNGSGGPLLYPDEELARNPHDWNGQPVVLYHPEENGEFVSAKKPVFFETRKIGTLFNTQHESKKLKTECWFDEVRTKELDGRVYEAIVNGKVMELSTGLQLEEEKVEGEFNGTKYTAVARNFRPDHLAMLPDKVGACSVKMGAGLWANQAKEPEGLQTVLAKTVENILDRVGARFVGNELSFSQTIRMLADLISARYGTKGKYWDGYVSEVYSDYLIFVDEKGLHHKISYTASDDSVKLNGSAVQVVRTVEYKPVSNVTTVPTKEIPPMFDKAAHINQLISNGQIDAASRPVFEAMTDDQLKAIKVVTPPAVTEPPPSPPVVNQQPKPANLTQWLQATGAPPEVVAVVNQGQQALTAQRQAAVSSIKANQNNKFTDQALADMDLPTLQAMAELAKTPAQPGHDPRFVPGWQPGVFGGMPGATAPVANSTDDSPELLGEVPDIEWENPLARK
jgi:hypothetical protein